ncbi:MAG: hypothetical protein ACTIDN_01885 [Acetobacter sp.]|uniref:hypothetical protein n=1 Tax=Acetobacter sp. TaxID=440 RepID=UPI003F9126B3
MQSGTYSTAPLAQGKPDPNLLLPPLSALAPPGKLAEASSAQAFAPMDTSSVDDVLKRAEALWGEHAPRIKSSTKATADQLGKFASTVVHQGEDTLQGLRTTMADPEKRSGLWARYRTVFIGGGVGLIVLAGVGWGVVRHEASTIADKKVQDFLTQSGLSPYVKYESVSATPFGSVTLHNVQVQFARAGSPPLKIGALSASGLSSSSTLPNSLDLTASDIDCPLNDVGTYTGGTFRGEGLRTLGYTHVTGNASLSYTLSGQTLRFASQSDFDKIGGWTVNFDLGGVPVEQLKALSGMVQNNPEQSFLMLMQLASQSNSAVLNSASLKLDNSGLVERAQAVPNTQFPQTETVPDAASPLEKWTIQGGKLTVTAQPQQPLPVMTQGFLGQPTLNPAFNTLRQFIAATHADVTAN